ncbi:MAG: hypothetical protein NT014_07605, partial [Candidatus Omnitrophica bacterium]|nr:hypothetical protein [Candidatus Omnitrophota bacterium]
MLKILILSNKNGSLAEGQKNVAFNVFKILALCHEVIHFNAKSVFSKDFWVKLQSFNPDFIYLILRPNLRVFLLGKILKLKFKQSKIILVVLQPPSNHIFLKLFIPFLKADLALVLSEKTEKLIKSFGINTKYFRLGVDILKFKPVSWEEKIKLRHKYNIELNKFVVLHVGHVTKGRNLLPLLDLCGCNGVEVIIVVSSMFPPNTKILNKLKDGGCRILNEFFDSIEELYQLSDAYVFLVDKPSSAIEMPLSILEAMACNTPV